MSLYVAGGQTATVAEFEAALRSVTFYNGSDTPGTLDRTISISFYDGTDNSNIATKTITVTAVNDLPVFDLDADDSSGGATGNHIASFTEGA